MLGVSQPWFVIDSEGASPWLLSPQPYLECTGTAVLGESYPRHKCVVARGTETGSLFPTFIATLIIPVSTSRDLTCSAHFLPRSPLLPPANGDTPAPASSSADSPFSPVASTSSPASLATDEAGNDLSGASAVGFGGDKPRLLGVAGLVGLLVGAFVPAVASAYCW